MRDRVQALELEVMNLRQEKQLADATSHSSRRRNRVKEQTFASPTQSYLELHRVPIHSDRLYEQLIHQTIHNTSRASQGEWRRQRKSSDSLVKRAGPDDSDIDADTRQLVFPPLLCLFRYFTFVLICLHFVWRNISSNSDSRPLMHKHDFDVFSLDCD